MSRKPPLIAIILLALLPPLAKSAGAGEPPLFPDVEPAEVECLAGRQQDLIPDGAHGLRYFPDVPISWVIPNLVDHCRFREPLRSEITETKAQPNVSDPCDPV